MRINTNIAALNLTGRMKLTGKQKASSTEKMSSGYRINRAKDDAANLSVSEGMRRLIRGLGQASDNIQDDTSYLQVGDAAMNEIHDILHRMEELTVKALNETNTDNDRAAMEEELDSLQSGIDEILKGTEFNSMSIFEEHEDTYYSIKGNVYFPSDQKHLVTNTAPGNTLSVKIEPDEYELTVPEGIYTTHELIDELDSAIREKYPDSGIYVTYTEDGHVNVNLENGEKIDSIGGGLAYLVYGTEPQKNEGLLIGVSDFGTGGVLDIIPGANDQLTFYLGNSETPITIRVDEGSYTREQLVAHLNGKLAGTGVEAQKYGDGFISLFCPSQIITGLAGNMIKCDGITSILYDISTYGTVNNSHGYVIGGAPLDETVDGFRTAGVTIKPNVNDILKFQLDGKLSPTYCIDLLSGKVSTDDGATWETYGSALPYTGEKSFASIYELTQRINEICDSEDEDANGKSIGLKASVTRLNTNIISYIGWKTTNFLKLESSLAGDDSQVTMIRDDPRSEAAFKDIFTEITYSSKAKYYAGSNEHLTGNAYLSPSSTSPVVIDDTNKTFTIRQTWKTPAGSERTEDFTITLPTGSYASISDLSTEINKQLEATKTAADPADPQNYARLTCGAVLYNDGYRLTLTAQDSAVTDISFPNISTEKGAHQLWRGDEPNSCYPYVSGSGNEGIVGSYKPAEYTGTVSLPEPVTVDFTNNFLAFSLDSTYFEIHLKQGTYTRAEYAGMLQNCIDAAAPGKLKVELTDDNRIKFSTVKKGSTAEIRYIEGTGLDFITGETLNSIPSSSSGNQNYLKGQKITTLPIVIDSTNNSFTFYANEPSATTPGSVTTTKYTVTVPDGSYADQSALAAAFNDALKTAKVNDSAAEKDLSGSYSASANTIGGISIYAPSGSGLTDADGNTYSPFDVRTDAGGFYDKVLCQTVTDKVTEKYPNYLAGDTTWEKEGKSNLNPAYIVGRMPLKGESVEIKTDLNDKLILNYTIRDAAGNDTSYKLDFVLDEGIYDNDALLDEIQAKLNQKLLDEGLITALPADPKDSLIRVGIDVVNTEGVSDTIGDGAISNTSQLYFYMDTTSTVINQEKFTNGTYILDGVRGTAAYTLFYKTEGEPSAVYIVGSADLSEGVTIGPENNEFKMEVDGVPITLPLTEGEYTADELIEMINDKLQAVPVPIEATLRDGHLKFEHQDLLNTHTIDHISGNGKTLFYVEEGRIDELNIDFQIGANSTDFERFKKSNLSTTLLGINSITISRKKYAQKTLDRLESALEHLNRERARFGTTSNRLDHTDKGNLVTQENLMQAESSLRDTDMAKEALNHALISIMEQAQQALMAQAKNMNQGILSLLGSF